MADFFQSSPNFVNPAYASPEQLATQRAYAAELLKRSGQDVNRPAGAIGNVLTAITAGLERRGADATQAEAAARNSNDIAALVSQLQSGQKPDAGLVGRIYANPMASPEHRAFVSQLITPEKYVDAEGRPGYSSPSAGVQAAPVSPALRPGIAPSMSTPDASISAVPQPAPNVQRLPAPAPTGRVMPVTPTNPQGGMYGGLNWRPVDTPPSSGGGAGPTAPGAGLPPAPAPAGFDALEKLAAKGRELLAERNRAAGGAEAEAGVIKQDVNRAASAPETLKGLGIMRNTIESVGDKMTFGPTAKLSNEARRVISNYAPGLVDERALQGADAIEKLNLSLAGNLSQQLGLNPSDIYRSVASVPGNEKSKAGTLALINMMEQAARNDQHVGTTLYQQNRGNLAAYQEARQRYYNEHPIVNPITGNPVQIDAQKAASNPAASSGPVRVTSPEEARKLPKGTEIILPDGSRGRVP